MDRQPELFEVTEALRSSSSCASRLDSGQQDCHQDSDDGNNHQKFNQREA
jgi:hypothetical protein